MLVETNADDIHRPKLIIKTPDETIDEEESEEE